MAGGAFIRPGEMVAQLNHSRRFNTVGELYETNLKAGDPVCVTAICFTPVLLPQSRKSIALPVCSAVFISSLVYITLKYIFASDRTDFLKLITETNYGFPSGPALNNTALYSMLIFLFNKYFKSSNARLALSFLFIFIIIAIGCSRVYLGVHNMVDTIGGWIFGFATAALTYSMEKPFTQKINAYLFLLFNLSLLI